MNCASDRSIRKLHVCQPVDGGVARVVLEQAKYEKTLDWSVAVACPSDSWLSREVMGADVLHIPWQASRSPFTGILSSARGLIRSVRAWQPDVVHLHSAKAGLVGRLTVRRSIPTIFQPHAWSFAAVNGIVGILAYRWERWAAAHWTDHLICVSNREAKELPVALNTAMTVVPNGVDPQRWAPRDRNEARQRLGIGCDEPLAICVGRIARQKGQDQLVANWASVLEAVPSAKLILVGAGHADLSSHDSIVRKSICQTGHVDPTDYYAAADVVIVPSRWEGMALVPLEAMAMERVVYGFDVAGLSEVVGRFGRIFPPGAINALLRAVEGILKSCPVDRVDGGRVRAHILEHYSLEQSRSAVVDISVALANGSNDRGIAGRCC